MPTIRILTLNYNGLARLAKNLKAEITVAYFTVDDEKKVPIVKNLDIRADGFLEKGLPMEFIGADVIEAIEMGA